MCVNSLTCSRHVIFPLFFHWSGLSPLIVKVLITDSAVSWGRNYPHSRNKEVNDSERLSCLFKVTQLVNSGAGIRTYMCVYLLAHILSVINRFLEQIF